MGFERKVIDKVEEFTEFLGYAQQYVKPYFAYGTLFFQGDDEVADAIAYHLMIDQDILAGIQLSGPMAGEYAIDFTEPKG